MENPEILAYREKIHKEFDDVVLRTEIIPDPPVRGRYGYAFIPLKEGYTPIRQKTFVQHGERHEAHIKITEDHVERKFIERPPPGSFLEFLTRTFVVPKKSTELPWRQVGDFRPLNSQSKRVSYPLPVIEDILVKQGKNICIPF